MTARPGVSETESVRSPKERRGEERRRTSGTGPGGVERRQKDRRTMITDRRSDNNLRLVAFRLAGEHYGIRVDRVQEILLGQEMTPAPNSDPSVQGLINLRGQIVTAIDLRKVLDLPAPEKGATPVNVIIRFPDGTDSLLVDEIGDVLDVALSKVEKPPATMKNIDRKYVEGVCKLNNCLLVLLELDQLTGRAA